MEKLDAAGLRNAFEEQGFRSLSGRVDAIFGKAEVKEEKNKNANNQDCLIDNLIGIFIKMALPTKRQRAPEKQNYNIKQTSYKVTCRVRRLR